MYKFLVTIFLISGFATQASVAEPVSASERESYVTLIIDRWRNTSPTRSGTRWETLLSQTLNQQDNQQLQYAYDAKTYERVVKIASAPQIDGIQAVSTNSMYYKAITPCRLVDTRYGTNPGAITGGTFKSFSALASSGVQNQGGTAGCGTPDHAEAVVVNIVSTTQSGNGHLRAFPFGETLPLAAILNYSAGVNIANSTILPICVGSCTSSFSIYSAPSASHVVIDIMGYFEKADTCVSSIDVGQTINGSLSNDGCVSTNQTTGHYAKYYTFSLASSAAVDINFGSDDIDNYLYLLNGHGKTGSIVSSDDDGGDGVLDSRIQTTLSAGDYTIEATSYSAGDTGSFTVSIVSP